MADIEKARQKASEALAARCKLRAEEAERRREEEQAKAAEIERQRKAESDRQRRQRIEVLRLEFGLPVDASDETILDEAKRREGELEGRRKAEAWSETTDLYWRASGVPVRHRENVNKFTGPPEWIAKREIAWDIIRAGGLIALIGNRGNGKTQMSADLIYRACDTWHPPGRIGDLVGLYLKAMDFFLQVRATFHEGDSNEQTVMRDMVQPKFLVLDNADRRGGSEWEDRLLTHVIDRRYDHRDATLLIANLDEAAFTEQVGPDIVDRIRDGGGLIVADWPGFRGA